MISLKIRIVDYFLNIFIMLYVYDEKKKKIETRILKYIYDKINYIVAMLPHDTTDDSLTFVLFIHT